MCTCLPIGRAVTLDLQTTDPYGRLVAEVIADININLAMVEDGQAFAYRQVLSGCDAKESLDAEFRASRQRYGVWQVEGGITRPWDFRRGRHAAMIPDGSTPGGRRFLCREIGSKKAKEIEFKLTACPTGHPQHRWLFFPPLLQALGYS